MKLSRLIPNLQRRLYLKYRTGLWRLNQMMRETVTVTTRQGVFTLPLEIDDVIGMSLYINGQFELDLVTEVMSVIREITGAEKGHGAVLDIGANNGVISIGMIVGGELDRAICIEPDPGNFALLQRNVIQNHLGDRVTCLNCAASDDKSVLEFEISDSNLGDHRVRRTSVAENCKELFGEARRELIKVEAESVDNILDRFDLERREEIRVVWVDVQGYEGYVFAGGSKIFSSGVPVVTEVWPYGIHRSGMAQETYFDIMKGYWTHFWARRRHGFIKYPIEVLPTYFEELGTNGDHENVILTNGL